MTMKSILFSLTFLAVIPVGVTQAAFRNTCDDMVESGKSTSEQIKKCTDKLGESETFKENAENEKMKAAAKGDKAAQEVARKNNVEFKVFTEKDLTEAAFGKSFYAIGRKYTIKVGGRSKFKDDRLTEGDSLCKYLGYSKATQSSFSPREIGPTEAIGNGFTIEKTLGFVKKEPTLYEDKNEKIAVIAYTGITCAKMISKDVDGTEDELKKMVETIDYRVSDIGAPKEKKNKDVNDSSRSNRYEGGTTPYGPQIPDYIKEDQKNATK